MNKSTTKIEQMFKMKNYLTIALLIVTLLFICFVAKGQPETVVSPFKDFGYSIPTKITKTSDTIEVVYVIIKEDFIERIDASDNIDTIPFVYLETIYGYHVQDWRTYTMKHFDINWNPIEEPVYIKRRKLFKK